MPWFPGQQKRVPLPSRFLRQNLQQRSNQSQSGLHRHVLRTKRRRRKLPQLDPPPPTRRCRLLAPRARRRLVRGEERFLREKFPEFDEYAKRVPRMLPRFTPARSGDDEGGFSMDLYLKHREWNALLGSVLLVASLILKMTLLH